MGVAGASWPPRLVCLWGWESSHCAFVSQGLGTRGVWVEWRAGEEVGAGCAGVKTWARSF